MFNNDIKLIDGGLTAVKGIETAGVRKGKYGLCLIKSEPLDGFHNTASGVFTSNEVKASPVIISKDNIKNGKISAIVANSGNANCFTGEKGFNDSKAILNSVSKKLKLKEEEIAIASTGVIGREMPMDIILNLIDIAEMNSNRESSINAAKAIMTTDTEYKEIAIESKLSNGKKFKIAGIAKGSGMIAPNMATMLVFIVTDIMIDKENLDNSFREAISESFNMLSVDGDESTNDTAIIIANGQSNANTMDGNKFDPKFKEALKTLCIELTKKLAMDAEGANKYLEVLVKGAKTKEDAKIAAKSIVNSSLVKTAVFGADPNWGRIVTALGYSHVDFNIDSLSVSLETIDEVSVEDSLESDIKKTDLVLKGEILGFEGSHQLETAEEIMKNDAIRIVVDLAMGKSSSIAYGCDLSYDYVKINAMYTT